MKATNGWALVNGDGAVVFYGGRYAIATTLDSFEFHWGDATRQPRPSKMRRVRVVISAAPTKRKAKPAARKP